MKNINDFLNCLKEEKNYSINTIISYETDLIEFYHYINKDVCNVSYQDFKSYLNYLYELKLTRNSINRKISTLKSFYNYLKLNNIIENNYTKLLKYTKKEKKLPNFLYYNELEKFIKSTTKSSLPKRDNLIIELTYATGVRVSELVNIKLEDIMFDDMSIKVLGKGSKERIVYFGTYALKAINDYLNCERSKLVNTKSTRELLVNKKGDKLTSRGIRYIFDTLLKKSSLDYKVSPHTLRHTFATHMIQEGCDIKVVKELLGHESLLATQIYTHVTTEGLRNVYNKCHPRNVGRKNV